MNDSVITQNKYFEAEPTGLVAGIKIKHLYKVLFQKSLFLTKTEYYILLLGLFVTSYSKKSNEILNKES